MDTIRNPLPADWKERAEAALHGLRDRLGQTRGPGFEAELRRQAAILRDAPEEQEALDFIEAVMKDWEATTNE